MTASIWFVIPLAVFSLLIYVTHMHFCLVARHWPSVEGKVLSSKVNGKWFHGTSDSFAGERYRAHIVYEYVVDGKSHTGDRVGLQPENMWDGRRSGAERIVKRFAKGASVRVYVDPGNAKRSAIAVEIPWWVWIVFAAPCLALIFAIVLQFL
jgi:hypothetical protein